MKASKTGALFFERSLFEAAAAGRVFGIHSIAVADVTSTISPVDGFCVRSYSNSIFTTAAASQLGAYTVHPPRELNAVTYNPSDRAAERQATPGGQQQQVVVAVVLGPLGVVVVLLLVLVLLGWMMERQGLPMLNHVLQHTLRGLCSDTQWVYAVFWRILPRNYPPPKWENEGGAMDRSKGNKRNWILVWEDGFCDFSACSAAREAKSGARYGSNSYPSEDSAEPTMHPELFFKMSHEVYNYGEGLMGKVAADNSHKWVYREPMEHEISFLSPWHGSLDPHPRTWEGQFKAGIQTVAVISVREGLVQLGSLKKVVEDLNFVILMQRKFNYLQSIPGVFVPHPSPLPGLKLNNSLDLADSPPGSDLGCWPRDQNQHQQNSMNGGGHHLIMRSNSDPFRLTAYSKQQQQLATSAGVLGIKRPNEDVPLSMGNGRDFPFLTPAAVSFTGSPRFNCSPLSRSPECPSPPKALNTGLGAAGNHSLLPSMSSLHNLLSKLPSVTSTENGSPLSSSPSVLSNLSISSQLQHSHSFPRRQQQQQPLSPTSSGDSPGLQVIGSNGMQSHNSGGGMVGDQQDASCERPSPPHQSCANGDSGGVGGSGVRFENSTRRNVIETSSSSQRQQQQQQQQRGSWHHGEYTEQQQGASGMSEQPNQQQPHHLLNNSNNNHQRPSGNKDKISSFLDSFDPDALSDLGELHEELLEASDTYNSLFSEIIS
ncbi:hypothetical protein R1flu_025812 [Riccia fluitans]|uniref:Transcription factor MYC/MYB N-terminal domain-containing protein n=1 Tax=Riccia fluitans TaxID=41844 RepID=A0ABD1XYT3_9MARC